MRVLLVTWGTTGDALPYAGLGTRLRVAGVMVTVATSERLAPVFRRHGMPVHVLPLAEHEESALAPDRFDRRQSPARLRRRKRNAQDMAQVIARGVIGAVAQGVDVILAHPLTHPLCAVIARGTGTRCVGVYTAAPAMLLPRLSAGSRMPAHAYRIAETLARAAISPLYAPALSWTMRELGVRRTGTRTVVGILRGERVLHGFSRGLLPLGSVLPGGHTCAGYWWPVRDPGWRPDTRLTDFLDSGAAPVFFGFGSVAPGDARQLGATIRTAVRELGLRAVVQAGWQGLDVRGDDILTIGECPHEWLFPRMAALVHHAGPGTVGAGLRAGVPAVPAPLALDQPFWARRMTALGLAPMSLDARSLTATTLAGALSATLRDETYRDRCVALSKAIAAEDGTARVLTALAP
ncbi:glycosyltransferase [Streptomyces sp. PTM05]|uniref:Glycosyltransferase n=1 Tax=Streptantibioticus parmotrematis TaxID=2873249 RepID=A0ABS7QKF4_9ACTN|nr:glycosyltransferase [Streptantibioticus parmotrematis]MBY8883661.1 glycosyltransferase [Streptantibioticus parmotrematis]